MCNNVREDSNSITAHSVLLLKMKSCAQKNHSKQHSEERERAPTECFGREKERFRLAKFSEIPEKYTQMASSGKIYLFLMSVCRYAVNQPESTQHSLVGSSEYTPRERKSAESVEKVEHS